MAAKTGEPGAGGAGPGPEEADACGATVGAIGIEAHAAAARVTPAMTGRGYRMAEAYSSSEPPADCTITATSCHASHSIVVRSGR